MNVVLLIGTIGWVCSVRALLDVSEGHALERDLRNESPLASKQGQRESPSHPPPVWIGKKFLRQCRAACDTFYGLCLPEVYDPENIFFPICEQHLKFRAAPKLCLDCMLENGLQEDEQDMKRSANVPAQAPVIHLHSGWPNSMQKSHGRPTTESSDVTPYNSRDIKIAETQDPSQDGDVDGFRIEDMSFMKVKKLMRTTESPDTSIENLSATAKPKKRRTKPMRTTEGLESSSENFMVTERPKKRITKPMRTTENSDMSSENFRVTEKPKKRKQKPKATTESPVTSSDDLETLNQEAKSLKGKAKNSGSRGKSPKRNNVNAKMAGDLIEETDTDYDTDLNGKAIAVPIDISRA